MAISTWRPSAGMPAAATSQLYTQSRLTGLKYSFSNGAAVATFPVNGTLMSGQKYFYFSKDGNFMFGGSPDLEPQLSLRHDCGGEDQFFQPDSFGMPSSGNAGYLFVLPGRV